MEPTPQSAAVPKWMLWTGWIIGVLPAAMLVMSGAMKLAKPEFVVEGSEKLGWGEHLLIGLGIVEVSCAIIYLIPQTAVLGAILVTGYMGGAIATHVRIGEPLYIQLALGLAVWGGLWLRDARLRALIPLRR